jgi:hypothetical protein
VQGSSSKTVFYSARQDVEEHQTIFVGLGNIGFARCSDNHPNAVSTRDPFGIKPSFRKQGFRPRAAYLAPIQRSDRSRPLAARVGPAGPVHAGTDYHKAGLPGKADCKGDRPTTWPLPIEVDGIGFGRAHHDRRNPVYYRSILNLHDSVCPNLRTAVGSYSRRYT